MNLHTLDDTVPKQGVGFQHRSTLVTIVVVTRYGFMKVVQNLSRLKEALLYRGRRELVCRLIAYDEAG